MVFDSAQRTLPCGSSRAYLEQVPLGELRTFMEHLNRKRVYFYISDLGSLRVARHS